MKHLLAGVFLAIENRLGTVPNPSEIVTFLRAEFDQFRLETTVTREADRIRNCLRIVDGQSHEAPGHVPFASAEDLREARLWAQPVVHSGILTGGCFAAGAGKMLDILDDAGDDAERDFSGRALERLMRHVEVKREGSLSGTFPNSPSRELLLQRMDVAILFSRSAVRRNDLRLLNCALKLNDRFFATWKRKGSTLPPEQLSRLLLSLAEQERAAAVLLQ